MCRKLNNGMKMLPRINLHSRVEPVGFEFWQSISGEKWFKFWSFCRCSISGTLLMLSTDEIINNSSRSSCRFDVLIAISEPRVHNARFNIILGSTFELSGRAPSKGSRTFSRFAAILARGRCSWILLSGIQLASAVTAQRLAQPQRVPFKFIRCHRSRGRQQQQQQLRQSQRGDLQQ